MSADRSAIIKVRLQPGAKEDAIVEWMSDGALKVRVKSKPIEGKANKNLIRFLGKQLNLPQSSIEIAAGGKSRNKVIKIRGMDQKELERKIKEYIGQEP